MKQNIRDDRRSNDRRKSDEKSDFEIPSEQRKEQRRDRNRRKYVRLAYPHANSPKVLNANFCIVDISQKGIAFICRENCDECTDPISLKSIVELKIQFHDKEIIKIKVEILRCERTLNSPERTYAGYVKKGISPERIAKEQTYLLSNFPDFLRASSD